MVALSPVVHRASIVRIGECAVTDTPEPADAR
jgi:hypothetical protein